MGKTGETAKRPMGQAGRKDSKNKNQEPKRKIQARNIGNQTEFGCSDDNIEHGGKREGAGRKPASDKKKAVSVRMYESDIEFVKSKMKMSEFIDWAVAALRR